MNNNTTYRATALFTLHHWKVDKPESSLWWSEKRRSIERRHFTLHRWKVIWTSWNFCSARRRLCELSRRRWSDGSLCRRKSRKLEKHRKVIWTSWNFCLDRAANGGQDSSQRLARAADIVRLLLQQPKTIIVPFILFHSTKLNYHIPF